MSGRIGYVVDGCSPRSYLPQPFPFGGIEQDAPECLGQRRNITDRDQDTSAAAVEDLAWSGGPRLALEPLVARHDMAVTVGILGQRPQSEVGMLMRDAEVLVFEATGSRVQLGTKAEMEPPFRGEARSGAPAPSPREARIGSGVRSHRGGPEVPLTPLPQQRPNRLAPRPRGEGPTRVARRVRGVRPLQTIAPPARTPLYSSRPMPSLLTVAIPAYNRPEDLGALLATILDQDPGDFDVLMVEDCSPRQADRPGRLPRSGDEPGLDLRATKSRHGEQVAAFVPGLGRKAQTAFRAVVKGKVVATLA